MSHSLRLLETIKAANIPIESVEGVGPSCQLGLAPTATDSQRTQALQLRDSFDWSQAAHDAWVENQNPERKTVRTTLATAVNDLNTIITQMSSGIPTNVQLRDAIRKLAVILKNTLLYVSKV